MVVLGNERLLDEEFDLIRGKRIGLITNPSGVDSFLRSTADRLAGAETELVAGIGAAGVRARHLVEVEDIVRTVVDEAREGDLVVVMSNGAFGGIHGRLLEALAVSGSGAPQPI